MTGESSRDERSAADLPEASANASRGISRRGVLKAMGIGGGTIILVGATGIGIRGGANGVWDQGQGAPYELWRGWGDSRGLLRFIAAGTLAANPHNIQPWSFAFGERTIDLYDDPARAMPIGDADGRERDAGYGCAIENIVVAARGEGWDAEATGWPDSDPAHVARIELTAGRAATERERNLAGAIPRRHSNRGPYASRGIDSATITALTDAAPDGVDVVWIDDASAMTAIGSLYVEATQAIVDDEQMSKESFSWFRNDRADIDRHRDGLTLDCQGLDGFTLFMAKVLPAQSRQDGDAFWVKTTRDVHTATARAYGIIRVPDTSDPHARLAGGRLLQHLHLAATTAGLGFQHMNQVTERIARDQTLGNPGRFAQRWADATGIPTGKSLLAFRIGYPERTANPSPRRALEDITR